MFWWLSDYPSNHSIRFDSTATQFQGSLFWEGEFLLLWSRASDQTSREGLCEDLSCRKSCLLWIKDLYFFVHRNYYWLVKLRNLDNKNGRWFCGSRQKAMLVHTVVVSVKCFFFFFPQKDAEFKHQSVSACWSPMVFAAHLAHQLGTIYKAPAASVSPVPAHVCWRGKNKLISTGWFEGNPEEPMFFIIRYERFL